MCAADVNCSPFTVVLFLLWIRVFYLYFSEDGSYNRMETPAINPCIVSI